VAKVSLELKTEVYLFFQELAALNETVPEKFMVEAIETYMYYLLRELPIPAEDMEDMQLGVFNKKLH
tara:strand:+ start:6983 stop:7183 length:201 start_codon:yes stop_codon:yes gene_type:complete